MHVKLKRKKHRLSRENLEPIPKPRFYSQKNLLRMLWKLKDIVDYKLLEHGKIITAENYFQKIDRMNEDLNRIYPVLVLKKRRSKGVILYHVAKQTQVK